MARREAVRREERVYPTPETLAKLAPAPWLDLPPDLERAWKQIASAVMLVAGRQTMRAAEMVYIDKGTREADFSPAQTEMVWRYRRWVIAMRAEGLNVPYTIGVIALDEPDRWKGLTLAALKVYAKINRGRY
ncbi:MAG TPA: hypothetical protein VND94_00920 [Terriglobia bacterium]|nr:hypothetical protein [Terriglobia bacterium]